jgi:quercetin dioxygenase-like cupin family protein
VTASAFVVVLGAAGALALQGASTASVLDNATVRVARVRIAQGGAYDVRADQAPILVVTMPRGDVQMIRSGMTRRLTNADPSPLELIAITIKPIRRPAEASPPVSPPPGIVRTTILETHDVRVVRATFARNGREPVHTHPNDLLTIQLTPGRVEIFDGSDRSTQAEPVGAVRFLPRNVAHAYASADTKAFDILSIGIK